MAECDVNDILCQLEVLRNLRGLKENLGNETFLKRFPQFEGQDLMLAESIKESEGDLREAISKCGNIEMGVPELEEMIEETIEPPFRISGTINLQPNQEEPPKPEPAPTEEHEDG